MSELIRAGAQSWYLEGPTQVGIIEAGEGKVWLIRSEERRVGKEC